MQGLTVSGRRLSDASTKPIAEQLIWSTPGHPPGLHRVSPVFPGAQHGERRELTGS
jgi:hypothetical protein